MRSGAPGSRVERVHDQQQRVDAIREAGAGSRRVPSGRNRRSAARAACSASIHVERRAPPLAALRPGRAQLRPDAPRRVAAQPQLQDRSCAASPPSTGNRMRGVLLAARAARSANRHSSAGVPSSSTLVRQRAGRPSLASAARSASQSAPGSVAGARHGAAVSARACAPRSPT